MISAIKQKSKDPYGRYVFMPIIWALKFIYRSLLLIPRLKVMHLLMEIEKLERGKKFDEARALRERWINKPKFAKFAELWFSEGKDLLYNQNEPYKAIISFEKAIEADAGFDPINLYYGAACSAIKADHIEKAEKYYRTFNYWWDKFMKHPELNGYYFTNYLGCKNWLDKNMEAMRR